MMRFSKTTTVALAVLLSGGALWAESGQSGNKGSSSQRAAVKQSSGTAGNNRSDVRSQQVSKLRQERITEPKFKVNRSSEPVRRNTTQQTKTFTKQTPVQSRSAQVNRPHYWTPPAAKPLPYYHRPGYVTRTLPKVAVTLSLGGLLFYYSDGIFYRHHTNGYVVILPPIGLIVPVLPLGYTVFLIGGSTYYYYAGVYYVWDVDHRAYRVTEVPEAYDLYHPGDIVDTLPDGAYTVTIDGVQYYRYDGVYFMQAIQGERIVYIVVTP